MILSLSMLLSFVCSGKDVPTDSSNHSNEESLAAWAQFLDFAKNANSSAISDETLRAKYGQDVKRKDLEDRDYRDTVYYKKPGGHGFDVVLDFTARPLGRKDYTWPRSTLIFSLPDQGCVDRESAKNDLIAAGFAFTGTTTSPILIDHYRKGESLVEVSLWTARRARGLLDAAKYGPSPALVCVKDSKITT